MGLINVDVRQLTDLASKIEVLNNQVNSLKTKTEEKRLKAWIDINEVCIILNVSVRTVQSYRDKGLLAYSQVGTKYFYKSEDVESLISNNRK